MKNLRKVRAFTLIELIVVIVIIGILLALAAVGYLSFVNNSNKKASFANAKQAATIVQGASATVQKNPNALTWGTANGGTDDGMAYNIKADGLTLRTASGGDGVWVVDTNGATAGGDVLICATKGGETSSIKFGGTAAAGSPPATTDVKDRSANATADTQCTTIGSGTVIAGA